MAVASAKGGAKSTTAKRGVSSTVQQRAGSISALWGKHKEDAKKTGFSDAVPLEPGKYTQQLVGVEAGKFGDERKIMARLCVVGMDDDVNGTICTLWFALEGDNIVWTQKALGAMGVDLDSVVVNDESDVLQLFQDLVDAQTVCATQVKTKGEHTNCYINGVADIDSSDLVDPAEVMAAFEKNPAAGAGKTVTSAKKPAQKAAKAEEAEEVEEQQDGEAGEGEVEVTVGSRVQWTDPKTKKVVAGEIIAFDADDKAVIRPDGSKTTVSKTLEQIEVLQEEEQAAEEEAAVEIEVDSVVNFKLAGKSKTGVVKKVDAKFLHVKVSGSPTLVKVPVDQAEAV